MNGDVRGTTLPHANFGAPWCIGLLYCVLRGDRADIVCNQCESVIHTVPPAELEQLLTEMGGRAPIRGRAAGQI